MKNIIIEITSGICKKCKKEKSMEGFCSRTSSPYCYECHNKRNKIRRFFEAFLGVPAWNY